MHEPTPSLPPVDDQQPNMYLNNHCLKRCHRSDAYDVEEDGSDNKGRSLDLTTYRKRKPQPSQTSTTRDSRLDETLTLSHPNFNEAVSSQKKLRRFSSIEETYAVPEPGFNIAPPTVRVDWDNKV